MAAGASPDPGPARWLEGPRQGGLVRGPGPGQQCPGAVRRPQPGSVEAAGILERMLSERGIGHIVRADAPVLGMSVLSIRRGLTVWCRSRVVSWTAVPVTESGEPSPTSSTPPSRSSAPIELASTDTECAAQHGRPGRSLGLRRCGCPFARTGPGTWFLLACERQRGGLVVGGPPQARSRPRPPCPAPRRGCARREIELFLEAGVGARSVRRPAGPPAPAARTGRSASATT